MRLTGKLLAICGALALIAVSAVPALADPPKGVTPRPGDVVGVGSDTTGYLLDQYSHDYNLAHPGGSSLLYSWDPTNPATGKTGGSIVTKATCTAIARPDGSSAGITALEANTKDPSNAKHYCIDYAGSSRGISASDPGCTTAGICFIPFAADAVTWATRATASGGTDAPASLTQAELKAIYQCKITNWAKVGGKSAPIKPFLPQTSSGTRAFWLTVLGGGKTPITPGPCVSDDHNKLQDNQGINPLLNNPEVIYPYSVADWIAQNYRDARCTKPSCTGSPACVPTGGENLFGCDEHGVLGLQEIGGTKPVTVWPPPNGACSSCAINLKFSQPFFRDVYVVVRFGKAGHDIPKYLASIFGASGYVCTDSTALSDTLAYAFLKLPLPWDRSPARITGGQCGVGSWIK